MYHILGSIVAPAGSHMNVADALSVIFVLLSIPVLCLFSLKISSQPRVRLDVIPVVLFVGIVVGGGLGSIIGNGYHAILNGIAVGANGTCLCVWFGSLFLAKR